MNFIMNPTKKTGNFSIMKKTANGTLIRAKYCISNVLFPFGKEYYNNNIILNGEFYNSTNYNYNITVTLNNIVNDFISLKDTNYGIYKYNINDKTFFSFLEKIDNDIISENSDNNIMGEEKYDKYRIRLHVKYGAKVTHIKYVGELTYDQLKGRRCNIDIELGSMWINENTKKYGINVYVTHITVLN